MSNMNLEKQFLRHSTLLEALDNAIKDNIWQQTPLLQTYQKRLQTMRDHFYSSIDYENYMQNNGNHAEQKEQNRTGQLKVYVSMYNSEGENIDKWYLIIQGLINGSIQRPVYRVEEDLRSLIRAKEVPQNEAYLTVYINNSDILEAEPILDQQGVELTQIKQNSIKQENIVELTHTSGSYVIKNNKLMSKELL